MRSFLVLCVLSCVHNPEPVVVPPTGDARKMDVQFVPDKAPTSDDLYVCSMQEGAFWCVEYELFLKSLEQSKTRKTNGVIDL